MDLHENFDYPREITNFDPVNLKFIADELSSCLFIWDIETGALLVLKEGDTIDRAYVGFSKLS